jgi:protein-tyrosine-phosphatase
MGASTMKTLLLVLAAAGAAQKKPADHSERADVVFVCAHGNVKSLIASQWFNRLAAERGIGARSVARGVTPQNPVPTAIADRLRREGMNLAAHHARSLAPADVEGAARLVLIGVVAPSWTRREGLEVESWDGIPAASESYEASRDALRARIEMLLASLPMEERPR